MAIDPNQQPPAPPVGATVAPNLPPSGVVPAVPQQQGGSGTSHPRAVGGAVPTFVENPRQWAQSLGDKYPIKSRWGGGMYSATPLSGDVSGSRMMSSFVSHLESLPEEERYYRDELGTRHPKISSSGHVMSGIEWNDPLLGKQYMGAGTDVKEYMARPQQWQAQKRIAWTNAGMGTLRTAITPSYAPGYSLLQQGGSMLAQAGAMGAFGESSAAIGMAGGVAAGVGAIGAMTTTMLASEGREWSQMERPLERLAHFGLGTGGLKGTALTGLERYSERYGYTPQEAAHITAEFSGAIGADQSRLTAAQRARMGDLPFEAELQGVSRGTVAFYGRNFQAGGGALGGLEGFAAAARGDIGASTGMGLRGGAISEYVQRIAATVEGIGQRGMKIDNGSVGQLASSISAGSLIAAGGDVNNAYGYGNRAANISANVTQFQAEAANMIRPNMGAYGRGLLLAEATRRASARGAGGFDVQEDLENLASNSGSVIDLIRQNAGGNRELFTQALRGVSGMSQKEASAFYAAEPFRPALEGVDNMAAAMGFKGGMFELMGPKREEPGDLQDVLKSLAENEKAMGEAIKGYTEEIKNLHSTWSTMKRIGVGVGASFANPFSDWGEGLSTR